MSCLLWIASNILLASLLALAACFVQRLGRHSFARVLWALVLVKLVTPPLVSVPVAELPNSVACVLGECGCEEHMGSLASVPPMLPWVLLVWFVGASVMVGAACRRWTGLLRLLAHARPAPHNDQLLTGKLASRLSLKNVPEVLIVPGRLPPMVVPGWCKPRLLLPEGLMSQLSSSQKTALLLHELTHIKRGDHLVRILELAVGVVYWWLPVLGVVGRQLRICEESSCDAAVVTHLPHARHDYAQLLLAGLDIADPLPPQAIPQATAMSAAQNLELRLRRILDPTPSVRRRWPIGILVVSLACVILPCRLHCDYVRQPEEAPVASRGLIVGATGSHAHEFSVQTISPYCCPN